MVDRPAITMKNEAESYTQYCLIFLAVFFLWAVMSMVSFLLSTNGFGAASASFGDSFGAVNALFSGLAMSGVVVALVIQSKDFSLAQTQRLEGLKNQRAISENQNQATKVQAIGLRMEIDSRDSFDPDRIHPNSLEYERLLREANYKFELDTIVSDLFQNERPSVKVFKDRMDLARMLVEAAWEIVSKPDIELQTAVVTQLRGVIDSPDMKPLLTDEFLLLNFEQMLIAELTQRYVHDFTEEESNRAYGKLTGEAIRVLGFEARALDAT